MSDTIKVRCANGHAWDVMMSTRASQSCGHDTRKCLRCRQAVSSESCPTCNAKTFCPKCSAGFPDDRPQAQSCPVCRGPMVHVVSAPKVTVEFWRR